MPQRGQETVIRVLRLWRRRDIPRRTRPTRVYPYCARHVSRTYRLSVVCTPRYDACATKVIVRGAHAGPRTLGHPPSGCGIDPRFFGIAHASPAGRSSAAARPDGFSGNAFCNKTCEEATSALPVPVVNQIRIYWWCSPPRTGRQRRCPVRSTARETGVSFSNDRCVRTSLYNTTTERPRDRGVRASLSVASLGRVPGPYS